MTEKRSYQRSPIELAASYGIPDDPRVTSAVKIKNISAGGFAFTSPEKLKIGKEIKLSVDLEEGEPLILKARVAWCKPNENTEDYHVGVQILETQGPAFERFQQFYSKTSRGS